MAGSAEARRADRAGWEIRKVVGAASDDEDARYWLRIPEEERARVAWELSVEAFVLAARNGGVLDEETGALQSREADVIERGLPRSTWRIERR